MWRFVISELTQTYEIMLGTMYSQKHFMHQIKGVTKT